MTIGTSDGQQYEDQFQHALAVGEPPYHPPEWRGNQWYKAAFDAAETGTKVRTESTESGAPEPIIPGNINPKFVPDMTGTSKGGWNRVSSTAPTMPLGATEKPAGEFKSNLGTRVAMDETFKASDALQVFQPSAIGEGKQHLPSMPAAPKVSNPERIISPAVKLKDSDKVFPGFTNHTEAINAAKSAGYKSKDLDTETFGGFLTNHGRYLNRTDALELAKKNGQYITDPYIEMLGPLHNMLGSHQVDWGHPGTGPK